MAQNSMKKSDLVASLAEQSGATKASASAMLSALSDTITEAVSGGGAVTIPGVGKISSRDRPARTIRNPRTGETSVKAADRAPKMTFAKALKDACN